MDTRFEDELQMMKAVAAEERAPPERTSSPLSRRTGYPSWLTSAQNSLARNKTAVATNQALSKTAREESAKFDEVAAAWQHRFDSPKAESPAKEPARRCKLEALSNDVLAKLSAFLTMREMLSISMANRQLFEQFEDDVCWKTHCHVRWRLEDKRPDESWRQLCTFRYLALRSVSTQLSPPLPPRGELVGVLADALMLTSRPNDVQTHKAILSTNRSVEALSRLFADVDLQHVLSRHIFGVVGNLLASKDAALRLGTMRRLMNMRHHAQVVLSSPTTNCPHIATSEAARLLVNSFLSKTGVTHEGSIGASVSFGAVERPFKNHRGLWSVEYFFRSGARTGAAEGTLMRLEFGVGGSLQGGGEENGPDGRGAFFITGKWLPHNYVTSATIEGDDALCAYSATFFTTYLHAQIGNILRPEIAHRGWTGGGTIVGDWLCGVWEVTSSERLSERGARPLSKAGGVFLARQVAR